MLASSVGPLRWSNSLCLHLFITVRWKDSVWVKCDITAESARLSQCIMGKQLRWWCVFNSSRQEPLHVCLHVSFLAWFSIWPFALSLFYMESVVVTDDVTQALFTRLYYREPSVSLLVPEVLCSPLTSDRFLTLNLGLSLGAPSPWSAGVGSDSPWNLCQNRGVEMEWMKCLIFTKMCNFCLEDHKLVSCKSWTDVFSHHKHEHLQSWGLTFHLNVIRITQIYLYP